MADAAAGGIYSKALAYVERAKATAAKAKEKAVETTSEVVDTAVTVGACFAMSYANVRYGKIKNTTQGSLVQLGGDATKNKGGIPVDALGGAAVKGAAIFGAFGKPSASGGLSANSVGQGLGTGLLCCWAARQGVQMANTANATKGPAQVSAGAGYGSYTRANHGVPAGVG